MSRISIPRKTDYTLSVTIHKSEAPPFPVGTYKVFLTVRERIVATSVDTDSDAIISKTETKVLASTASEFTVNFELDRDETNINIKQYVYDVQMLDSDDKMYQVSYGEFVITPDVTRRDE